MSSPQNLPDYITSHMKELQTEVETKAKILPDGSPSLEFSKHALSLFIGVFHETETHKEAADQVELIIQKARRNR